MACTGLAAPQLVGSSWTRDRTHVPRMGRLILLFVSLFILNGRTIALQSCVGLSRSSTRITRGYTGVFCFWQLLSTPCVLCVVAQSCPALCDPTECSPPGSSLHGDSPGQNTGVGCQALLQGIFRTQGSNPGLAHCRRILYRLSHRGSRSTPGVVTEHPPPAFSSNFPPATYFTRASVRVSILSLHLPHPPLLPLGL